jgi:predicted RNA-binding Zn ribbon-like protein
MVTLVTQAPPSIRSIGSVTERQPGDRAPAPAELGLVQAFANTFWDLAERRPERFRSSGDLARWLAERGLLPRGVRLARADLRRSLDVRDGLRELMFANNGADPDADAIARMNDGFRGRGLFVALDPSAPADFAAEQRDLDGALALFGTIVAVAQLDGRWPRLKACGGDHCGWAFYDYSRNQASSWCSMSICGQRTKAREYRRRRRSGAH